MKRILAKQLPTHVNQKVQVKGWLNNIRAFGKVNFLVLRDRTGLLQVVIQDKQIFQKIAHLQPGSVLTIEGDVVSSQAELKVEMTNPQITIDVPITEVPLIEYYKPELSNDLDFILDHRPIALRNRQIQAVFKIQASLAHAYRFIYARSG